MSYAKIVNGDIVFAPRKLRDGETSVYNPPEALLREHGYKLVKYTEPPTVEPGFIAITGWSETAEEIVQTWTVEEEPDEVDADRAMEILFGEEES